MSDDNSARVWKIEEEKQLVYTYGFSFLSYGIIYFFQYSLSSFISLLFMLFALNAILIIICIILLITLIKKRHSYKGASLDTVSLINEGTFVTGGQDGYLQFLLSFYSNGFYLLFFHLK